MTRLLRRASLRFYLRHPWQLGLAIAGISLGVGVYVGVGLANDSAARAFDVAATQVRGAVTHRILPLGDGLDERLYVDLVLRNGGVQATPVVEGVVGIAGRAELRVPLIGIEPLRGSGRGACGARRAGAARPRSAACSWIPTLCWCRRPSPTSSSSLPARRWR